MPRTIKTTVFKYDELSDEAKAKAREWFREADAGETYFAESILEDAERCAALMGITIGTRNYQTVGGKTMQEPDFSWSLGYCQGDFVAFDGSYAFAPNAAAKIAADVGGDDLPILTGFADRLEEIQANYSNALTATIKYHHHFGLQVEVEFSGEDELSNGQLAALDEAERAFKEVFKDFCKWIYNGLRKEHEYQTSDEQVEESISANAYEFTADGKIV